MSLTVDVLPVEPLPAVRLLVSLPQGRSWKVTGSAAGGEWLAGEGHSSGHEVAFADPWAPLGIPVSYVLTSGTGERFEVGPVVRTYRGQHALTDLTGRTVVDFLWEKSGGDGWTRELRASFTDVWGSRVPVVSAAPVGGAGGGSLTARTVGGATAAMRGLVEANRPLLLLHNAKRCRLPECDVPPVRTVLLTDAPESLTSRMDRAERSWSLSYRLVPRPYGFLAPVATWADVAARWATNADLVASGLSNLELARGDWLVEW